MRWFSVITRISIGGGVLELCRRAVGVFYTHSRPGFNFLINLSIVWFLCHILYRGLLNANTILEEEQQWDNLIHSQRDKGFYTFFNGISTKGSIIPWMEFELAYFESVVQHFTHVCVYVCVSVCVCVCMCVPEDIYLIYFKTCVYFSYIHILIYILYI